MAGPGIEREAALRLATSFGRGIAHSGRTCGAVTGALMAIGLKYGVSDPKSRIRKARAYRMSGRFMERFARTTGSLRCSDLLGLDLGREKRPDKDVFTTVCPRFVRSAGEILEKML